MKGEKASDPFRNADFGVLRVRFWLLFVIRALRGFALLGIECLQF